MRPLTLGRKNWLFAGSDVGGERAAAIYSLTETAKLNMLDPEDYLRQVLKQIAGHPVNRVHECCLGTCPASAPGSISARLPEPLVQRKARLTGRLRCRAVVCRGLLNSRCKVKLP